MNATVRPNLDTSSIAGGSRLSWTVGRILSVVTGTVFVLISLALITGGGYLASEAAGDGGWLALGHGEFQTETYAVVSEPNDWSTQTYVLENVKKVRIRVTPSDVSTPIFVGMARPEDVQRYLNDVKFATVHGGSNYHVTYTQHDGHAPATPPAQAIPWTVQTTGTGTQTLEFKAQEQKGGQVLVVMNADGSPSVSGKAESAATQPSVPWIAGGLLPIGIVIAVGSVLLIVMPIRRVRGRS